jgi:hypothetical protein
MFTTMGTGLTKKAAKHAAAKAILDKLTAGSRKSCKCSSFLLSDVQRDISFSTGVPEI